jgi:uncharacterized membrane protein YfbV (UPF0208 family)
MPFNQELVIEGLSLNLAWLLIFITKFHIKFLPEVTAIQLVTQRNVERELPFLIIRTEMFTV